MIVDIGALFMDLIKDVGATNTATLDLLIEKGLIEPEDLKTWEKLKSRNLAKLDQLQTAIQEKVEQQFKEELDKQKSAEKEIHPKKPGTIGDFLRDIFGRAI